MSNQGPKIVHETKPGNYVVVAVVWETENEVGKPDRAPFDAARITACVNACKGINPDAVPELLQTLDRIASGEFAANVTPAEQVSAMRNIARAAIAKATGGGQ